MVRVKNKKQQKTRRHHRVRAKIYGTSTCPRISVFKSNRFVYVQAIDDVDMRTVASAYDRGLKNVTKFATKSKKSEKALGPKEEKAFVTGQELAAKLKKLNIVKAVFDRGGFKYHGRIRAVADGLRQDGIKV